MASMSTKILLEVDETLARSRAGTCGRWFHRLFTGPFVDIDGVEHQVKRGATDIALAEGAHQGVCPVSRTKRCPPRRGKQEFLRRRRR